MPNLPEIHHWLAGDAVNAIRMNEIGDQIKFMMNPPLVHVARRLTQQAVAGTSYAKVSFDTVISDPYGMFDAGTPDQVMVTVPGWYSCEIVVAWASFGAVDTRVIMALNKNDFSDDGRLIRYDQETLPATGMTMRKEAQLFFNVGDTAFLNVQKSNATTQNLSIASAAESCQLRMRWISS